MNNPDEKIDNIDDYISQFPESVQNTLQEIRETIRQAAPEAEEAISYQVPTFKLNGNLVHFGGFKNHISFFPSSSGIEAFKDELTPYKVSKGTIQFPLDQPVPYDLITRIVKYRVMENQKKEKKKDKR